MIITALIHGIIMCIGLILPLGIQNVFIFNQGAMQPSYRKALPVTITASICDTLLIVMAVLGVSVIVMGNMVLQTILFGIGIIFITYMGIVSWRNEPTVQADEGQAMSPRKQILFTLSVSLLNPHAIMDTIGVIGTNALAYTGTAKIVFTLACVFVSWTWFFSIALAGRLIGRLPNATSYLRVLNRTSAVIMFATVIYLVIELVKLTRVL